MTEFKEEEFYSIFTESVRPGFIVPFDCYIYLKQSKGAYLLVEKDTEFPLDKYNKIKSKSYDKLYVKTEFMDVYKKYLKEFFKTEDGQRALESLSELDDISEIDGLPSVDELEIICEEICNEEEANMQAIKEKNSEPRAGDTSANKVIKLKVEGKVDPQENFDKIKGGSILDGPLGDIISSIRKEVLELESLGIKSQEESNTSLIKVEECTAYLNDEFIKVEEKLKIGEKLETSYVANLKREFGEHLQYIQGSMDEKYYAKISSNIQIITDNIQDLEESVRIENYNPSRIRRKVKFIQNQTKLLRRIAKQDEVSMVSQALNSVLGNIESTLGEKVLLNTNVAMYVDIPDYLNDKIDLDDIMQSKSEDIKILQHQIVKQNLLIQELTQKYEKARRNLKTLKDEWFLFHVQAKRNLGGSDAMAAKKIDKQISEFVEDFDATNSSSKTLFAVASDLTKEMGGKYIELDPELLAKIGAINASHISSTLSKDVKAGLKEIELENDIDTDISIEQESVDVFTFNTLAKGNDERNNTMKLSELIEITEQSGALVGDLNLDMSHEEGSLFIQLKSENELLKTQLENAQKLVDTGTQKISELSELIKTNAELTESLEAENDIYRKMNSQLEEQVEKFQTNEDMFHDSLSIANKGTKEAKTQLENQDEMLIEIKEKLRIREVEILALKKDINLDQVVEAKDDYIDSLNKNLDAKREEINKIKKDLVKAKTDFSSSEQKFNHFAKKMNRMKLEYDALKKTNRSVQAKAEGGKNALQQARKTISKLTTLSDQLRKDRQMYIKKTNESMSKFKAMTSQASNLNRQVESEARIKASLEKKLKKSIETENKLREKIKELQTVMLKFQNKKVS